MKALASLIALACLIPAAHAAEYGRVVGKSEIVKQVPVGHQVCRTEDVTVAPERSAGGAVVGGIAGGVLGHTVGRGSGKVAATAIGAITGAIVGDRVDNRDATASTRQVQRCYNEQSYEDQVIGYRVTYEYAGKRYNTRMSRDPGDRVEVRVLAVGGDDDSPASYTSSRRDDDSYDDEDSGYRRSDYQRRR